MKSPIIPTVFARSQKKFNQKLHTVMQVAPRIHIDVMDGRFVSARSISISKMPNFKKYTKKFDAHLMVNSPLNYIKKIKHQGFHTAIFHYEALRTKNRIEQLSNYIHSNKMHAVLALNPRTQIKTILPFLPLLDGVLIMGVYPGKEHQTLTPNTYSKIRLLRKKDKHLAIHVDGGVNPNTTQRLARAGADALNSGSFISSSDNPLQSYRLLHSLFAHAKR